MVANATAWTGPGLNVRYSDHGEWYCWMRLLSGTGVDEATYIEDLSIPEDVACQIWMYPNGRAFMACRNNVILGGTELSFRRGLNIP